MSCIKGGRGRDGDSIGLAVISKNFHGRALTCMQQASAAVSGAYQKAKEIDQEHQIIAKTKAAGTTLLHARVSLFYSFLFYHAIDADKAASD